MKYDFTEELKFYKVDKDYIKFLQDEDRKAHGLTCVPNFEYMPPQKEKFSCGIIFSIGGILYLAPVTSYTLQQQENVLLYDRTGNATSSVRLNFMFPVTPMNIEYFDFNREVDKKYLGVIQDEYKSVNRQRELIRKTAVRAYQKGKFFNAIEPSKSFCNFLFLEGKCKEYFLTKKNYPTYEVISRIKHNRAPDTDAKGLKFFDTEGKGYQIYGYFPKGPGAVVFADKDNNVYFGKNFPPSETLDKYPGSNAVLKTGQGKEGLLEAKKMIKEFLQNIMN